MFLKLGEAFSIRPSDLQPLDKLSSDIGLDIETKMTKFAEQLKVIAPQAKDFLYFTCVMMHAAEAALVNDDGSPKKMSNGSLVTATWEPHGEDSIKWSCSDKSIMPYRNSNRDIFRAFDLKLAYKNWVGRPLCLDHQSQSVDKIRGVIVDTVYDEPRHRVIALCALDKKNYPDLADKVTTGVSKDVSMGVAVGRAICSDCGRGARTEKEFCSHMKNKSCYGEINTELSPIELSLVVNGADKKAKVKHIIASDVSKAAELLTDYLQLKEAANKVSTNDLESIKEELSKLTEKVTGLINDSGNEDDESDAIGPTRSKTNWAESIISDSTQFNVPEAIPTYASALQVAILGAQTKIASLQENLLRLSKSEESTMSTKNAYFQGTEEPKPGQKQYAADPLNEKARELDKNLVNITNTGNDGMFPGDDQKKKDLLRLADAEERALFREAALEKAKQKLGYFNGTEEPKGNKKGPQYTPDPLEMKDRQLDKQMVGKSPFPNTGKVDELFPGDAATKEKLCRASLKARFEKVAMPDGRVNRGASRWVVIANEQPILSATVDQITKGNTEVMYDAVATASFGKSILTRIQQDGFEATASSLLQPKTAQAAPPAPPVDFGGVDADGITPPADVTAEEADPAVIVDQLGDLVGEMEAKLSDLEEKVVGPIQEDAENLGAVPPAGDEAFAIPEAGAVPAKSASQLMGMRKRVNAMLQEGISDTTASLTKHIKEIKTASSVYEQSYTSMTGTQRDYLNQLTVEAVKDARAALSDTSRLMEAVVKYAYGTAELEKRAQMTDAEKKNLGQTLDQEAGAYVDQIAGRTPAVRTPGGTVGQGSNISTVEKADPDMAAALRGLSDSMKADDGNLGKVEKADPEVGAALKGMSDAMKGDKAKADDGCGTDDNDLKLKPAGDDTFEVVNASTKEDRALLRAKLAEKAQNLGFNSLSDQAHPKGSVSAVEIGNLSTKPSIEAGFHVQKDIKEEMLGLANMPPKVRKQAELIQSLVVEGKLAADDVDELVSHGVDADAVKYWKAMWGQAKDKESSEFATKLTTEHVKAAAAEENATYQGKIKRAYEMANQMLTRGMIAESQVDSQVGEIMKWNDAGFESFKSLVSRTPMVRQASVPMVGLTDSGFLTPSGSFEKTASKSDESDLLSAFNAHFDRLGVGNHKL
jgi:hypothetical protein